MPWLNPRDWASTPNRSRSPGRRGRFGSACRVPPEGLCTRNIRHSSFCFSRSTSVWSAGDWAWALCTNPDPVLCHSGQRRLSGFSQRYCLFRRFVPVGPRHRRKQRKRPTGSPSAYPRLLLVYILSLSILVLSQARYFLSGLFEDY